MLCKTADAAIYEAIFSLTYKPALLRQAAWIAVCLCKHVQPCVTSPSIPVRPESMQRLEVMAQITVPWLGVSLVVFTKHCTIGIQSVVFNSPTDALMAYDLYTETYLELCTLVPWACKWIGGSFFRYIISYMQKSVFSSCPHGRTLILK